MVDAISLEVFKNLFASVAEEMGITLQRASFSPNIKERLDFSCALFDSKAQMIAQAAHIPVHLGAMPASVRAALQKFPRLGPGDVVILNDPYQGGSHLPDITMVSPVFVGEKQAFLVASRAHHADVGGMSAGSMPLSTELYQEGLIIPPLKLMENGLRNEALLSLITANSRTPEERLGDLDAQLAAHRIGEKRLLALTQKYGLDIVQARAEALLAYSRRLTEAIIQNIPDGIYTFEDFLEAETLLPIRVAITVAGAEMQVDFSGSAPQMRGNLNAVEAIVQSATWYAIRLLAEDDIPVNQGIFDPVKIFSPPHSILNPDFPAAVALGNVETSQRVVDVVLGALAQALPHKIPAASQGTMNNFTFGGIWNGKPFVYYETLGGGHGASPAGDGIGGRHAHMTNTLNTPVEVLEAVLPVRILDYCLLEDSGGQGRFRGGDGLRRVYEFLAPATVTFNTERRQQAPYGLAGGGSGRLGVNKIIQNGEEKTLPAKITLTLEAGDQAILETPSGGGYGTIGD